MSFSSDINKFTDEAKQDTREAVSRIFARLGTLVVERTPVGDITTWKSKPPKGYRPGTLANNWFASIGSPDAVSLRAPNASAAQSLANINIIANSAPGNIAVLYNIADHANRIEYAGWSSQAPAGMARRTAAEFKQIVTVSVNGIK